MNRRDWGVLLLVLVFGTCIGAGIPTMLFVDFQIGAIELGVGIIVGITLRMLRDA